MGEGVAQDEMPPLIVRGGSSAPVLALRTLSCGGLSPPPLAMPMLHGTQIARPGADGKRKACHFSGPTDIWAPQEASCASAPRAIAMSTGNRLHAASPISISGELCTVASLLCCGAAPDTAWDLGTTPPCSYVAQACV